MLAPGCIIHAGTFRWPQTLEEIHAVVEPVSFRAQFKVFHVTLL